jgi:hypothetical protein
MGVVMQQSEPSQINQLAVHNPRCARCSGPTILVGIEPASEPDHDLRTFECVTCGTSEVVRAKFR